MPDTDAEALASARAILHAHKTEQLAALQAVAASPAWGEIEAAIAAACAAGFEDPAMAVHLNAMAGCFDRLPRAIGAFEKRLAASAPAQSA
ncbi:hypothetical protein PQ455_07460 [Sphingomonas naphthae]|uniref:Uncharacterized protein n=1 Tax=Sphingomonas naphthae TaxID=1813468 RepID=A0ABY7TPL0_9SPHN|nr:hypothetical protein [Sphingomonas naphthae]WCT75043.1 hypothetical protein PQ455_07460 [Sphingomonas naphthae]